jgi:hypothetical protein
VFSRVAANGFGLAVESSLAFGLSSPAVRLERSVAGRLV